MKFQEDQHGYQPILQRLTWGAALEVDGVEVVRFAGWFYHRIAQFQA